MTCLTLRRIAGDLAHRAPQKKREVIKLVFPILSLYLHLLRFCAWPFFLSSFFFNRSVLESGTRAYPTKPRLSVLLWGDISPHSEAYSLLRSRSRRAIERVGRETRSVDRTYIHMYVQPTGRITTAFVPRLEHTVGRSSTWPRGRQSSAAEL